MDASSPDNVWAVGMRTTEGNFDLRSLVEQWDGQAWSIVPCPNIGIVRRVAVITPNDVWAVGGGSLLHWDGQTCQTVAILHAAEEISLSDIAATGPDNVWVVGVQTGQEYAKNTVGWNTLVAHFDGNSWSVLPTPNRSIRDNYLHGVVALSPSDVWAAGYSQDASGIPQTLLLHFDGNSWQIVPSPERALGKSPRPCPAASALTPAPLPQELWRWPTCLLAWSGLAQALRE